MIIRNSQIIRHFSSFILLDTGIMDRSLPVEAEGEIVGMAVGILIAAHVAWHVLLLLLDGLHVGRHLHGQEGRGLCLATDDVEQGLMLDVEGHEDGIGRGFNLGEHHGAPSLEDDDDGLVAHCLLGISH